MPTPSVLSVQVVISSFLNTRLAETYALPFFILSVLLNLSLTAAIILRLCYLRKSISVFGPEFGRSYATLSSMFIESGALYASLGTVYVACLLSRNVVAQYVVLLLLVQAVVSDIHVTFVAAI